MKGARAFTLIELLVVIAIIAVLAGVMIASFGGATDSARSALCLTNMKNLAQAVNTYAMKEGVYPLAGSREAMGIDYNSSQMYYKPQPGWISWLDEGAYENGSGVKQQSSHVSVSICPFYGTGDVAKDTYAITNGTLWKATSYNKKIYTCPEHVRYRANLKKEAPLWSYVMNSRFGYDTSQGSTATTSADAPGVFYNTIARTDRVLLFAELPTLDPATRSDIADPSGAAADCTLQFKATVNGTSYGNEWSGTAETIGFPHRTGKRDYCGHVVFADAHTETLKHSEAGLKLDELTALLCMGIDVSFDEKAGYKLPPDADAVVE